MKVLLRAISLRRFREHKVRTLLTVIGIGLGVTSYLSVAIIVATLQDSFAKMIDLVAGKIAIQVSGGPTGVQEAVLETARAVPGVQTAVPSIQNYTKTQDGQALMILAIDTLNDAAVRDYAMKDQGGSQVSDPLQFLNARNAVLLNREFAVHAGIQLDSTITLLTSQGRMPFVVRGLLDSIGPAEAFGGRFALMDVYAAQLYFGKKGVFDTIDVLVKPGFDVGKVEDAVRDALGGTYEVQRPAQRTESVENMMTTFRQGLSVLSMVVLIMGVFIIFNTVFTSVYQRKREIGMMRMVGATRRDLVTMFCVEGLLMGVLGSLLGIAGGYYMGLLAVKTFARQASSLYVMVDMSHAVFTSAMAAKGAALGLGVAFLASLYPAWRASTVSPLEVVHSEVSLTYGRGAAMRRYAAALAVSGVALAVGLFWPGFKFQINGIRTAMIATLLVAISVTPLFMRVFLPAVGRFDLGRGAGLRRLAVENILRDLGRAGMTVSAFMLAMAIMLDIYIYVRTMRSELKDWMDEAMKADVLVTSSSTFANRASIPVESSLGDRIAGIDGVDAVARVRVLQMDYAKSKIVVLSLEMPQYLKVHRLNFLPGTAPDAIERLRRGEGIALSENLVVQYPELQGAKTFPLRTPTGVREVPVVGVCVDYTSETGTVLIDRRMYLDAYHDDLTDSFQVYLKPGASSEAVRKRIYEMLGADFNLFVLTNREFKASILEAIDQMFSLAYSLELIAMLIAFIGIVNNLMATVIDRTREIGVLRAIGTTQQQVGWIFVIQAGLLGISGAVVSIAAGLTMGSIHIGRMNRIFGGWTMPMHYSWTHILLAAAAAIVIGIAAGFFPARHAAALRMSEALSYE